MVDSFALALSHGVLMLAFWRLQSRDDLDREPGEEAPPKRADRSVRGGGNA